MTAPQSVYPQDVGRSIVLALELALKRGMNQTQFAEALGVKPQHVTNWKQRGLPPERLEEVSRLLNCSVDYLLGRVPTPQPGLVAHPLTLDRSTVPPTISWSELSMTELPEVFRTTVPDTALAPRVTQGATVVLTRGLEPKAGDGVLVQDGDGHHYLRLYRERRVGHWEAHALNDSYRPLDSQIDRLRVVAVITATEGRWA